MYRKDNFLVNKLDGYFQQNNYPLIKFALFSDS